MTTALPLRRRRIFHVPKGVAYAIENSPAGIRIADRLGFRWIDLDAHVTADGVVVVGHWGLIQKDLFDLPPWFIRKYGHRPHVEDVSWADLRQLRTTPIRWRGQLRLRRYRYMSLARALELVADTKRLGIALEVKGSHAFRERSTFDAINIARINAGLPRARFMVMTLSSLPGALARLRAAHHAGFATVVLPRGPKPANYARTWAPYVMWRRGRWTRGAT